MKKLKLDDFTENHAKEICSWKYNDGYSIYDYPEWDKILYEKWGITVEDKRKHCYRFHASILRFS